MESLESIQILSVLGMFLFTKLCSMHFNAVLSWGQPSWILLGDRKKKTRRVASCKRSQPVFAASNCSSSRSPGGAPSGVDRWTTKERGGTIFLRRFLEIGSDMIWIDDRQSRMDEKEGVRFWKAGMRPFTLHIPAPKGPRDATTLAKPFSSVRLSAGRSPGSFVFSRGHGALCSK